MSEHSVGVPWDAHMRVQTTPEPLALLAAGDRVDTRPSDGQMEGTEGKMT